MAKARIGDKIRINYMSGEPSYTGREGLILHVDDIGQLHGTWGGCAVMPGEDSFEIIEHNGHIKENNNV